MSNRLALAFAIALVATGTWVAFAAPPDCPGNSCDDVPGGECDIQDPEPNPHCDTPTDIPPTPTDLPPTPTDIPPTATDLRPEPTATAIPDSEPSDPTPTSEPVVTVVQVDTEIVWVWLLFHEDTECSLLDWQYDGSYDSPSIERQLYWCGWIAENAWGGYVTVYNTWTDSGGADLDSYYTFNRYDLQQLLELYPEE